MLELKAIHVSKRCRICLPNDAYLTNTSSRLVNNQSLDSGFTQQAPILTLPTEYGWYFAEDILKCILLNENFWFSNRIALKYVSWGKVSHCWFK